MSTDGHRVPNTSPTPMGADRAHGYTITVASRGGGTGKSLLSLNLAAHLGLRLQGTGRTVCFVDADSYSADVGKYLNAWAPNIEGLLREPSAIHSDRIHEFLVHRSEYNLSALLGHASPGAGWDAGLQVYSTVLDALRATYDYVVIDTPIAALDQHAVLRDLALPRADYVIAVVPADALPLRETGAWLEDLAQQLSVSGTGADPSRIGVVVNRAVGSAIPVAGDDAPGKLAKWPVIAAIPEAERWQASSSAASLIAARHFPEIDEAFATMLQAATNGDLVNAGSGLPAAPGRTKRWRFGGKKK